MDWRQATQRLSCALLLAAAALPLAAISPAPTARTCDALSQWARDHRDSLPRDYRGMLAHPVDEQRAIYNSMSAEQRAGYWNDRIGVYLEEHPDLTAGQQRAIAEAQAFVKADVFALAQPGMPENAALVRFSERMAASLGEKVSQQLFYGFDSAAAAQLGEATNGLCQCYALLDCMRQGIPGNYCGVAEPCDAWIGCGFMGNFQCDGMCKVTKPRTRSVD